MNTSHVMQALQTAWQQQLVFVIQIKNLCNQTISGQNMLQQPVLDATACSFMCFCHAYVAVWEVLLKTLPKELLRSYVHLLK